MKPPIRTIVNADVLIKVHKLSIAWLIRQHVKDEFNENVWGHVKRRVGHAVWAGVAEPVYNNINEWIASYQKQ